MILRYENLTHAELAGLRRDRTIVFLAVGPLEEHGPHLPLGVDGMTAYYFCERLAGRLTGYRDGWDCILLPVLFAGSDTLIYTGSIEVRPHVLHGLLYDCCKKLAADGFRNIVAVNAHGGPRHAVVIEEVAELMRWRHRARMVSASARILLDILEGRFVEKIARHLERKGHPLSAVEIEGLKQDYHGGMLETSIMMVARPNLVKPTYRELKPALVKSYWRLRRSSAKTVGEGLGYLGSPALARPEIGEAAVEVFLDDVVPLLEKFLDGENVRKSFRSKFYYVPFLRTHFRVLLALILGFGAFGAGLALLNRYFLEIYR